MTGSRLKREYVAGLVGDRTMKLTHEEVISRFKSAHGDLYDYGRVKYLGKDEKVTIICRNHGEFQQRAAAHWRGQGCGVCGRKAGNKTRTLTQTEVIERFKKVHGTRYDYSQAHYSGDRGIVKIICREHGVFRQRAANHWRGDGCPVCGGTIKFTADQAVSRFREIHGGRYDYSIVEYVNQDTPVKIICMEHGLFEQRPVNHWNGRNCYKCSLVSRGEKKRLSTAEFIQRSESAHGDKYDYSETEYSTSKVKVKIICREHGAFEQEAFSHLMGSGCPVCATGERVESMRLDTETWIDRFQNIHGNRYDYSMVKTGKNVDLVKIICREHGVFEQSPVVHEKGCGCQKCSGHKLTQSERIEIFRRVHGDQYDYSMVEYVNNHTKVKIICREHGVFEQQPSNHLSGNGCPKCWKGRDNDAIYILRAANQQHQGGEVHKIGVTSWRLGKQRLEQAAKAYGVTMYPLLHARVRGDATEVERALLDAVGVDPQFTGFDGCTEYRAIEVEDIRTAIKILEPVVPVGEELEGIIFEERIEALRVRAERLGWKRDRVAVDNLCINC